MGSGILRGTIYYEQGGARERLVLAERGKDPVKVPVVDYIECLGCETCAIMCPEVFYMSHDKAWVRDHAPYEDYDIRKIWRSCPARCITFVDVPDDYNR